MSQEFDILYPSTSRLVLDGGKNSKFERAIIEDRDSPDCANVIFSNGAIATRGGSTKLNTSSVGSFVCDGIYTRRSNTSSETMVAFFGGSAWQLAVTTFSTIPSAQSVFTAGVRVAATQYENHMFVGNGGVIPYKYNGTDFTRHGVYPPPTTMSIASNGSGNLAGDYMWKVTFVNSQLVEGDVGPASTFTVTASGQVILSSIPVAPQSWGVSTRYIYRTNAGGSTFRRIATLADNTTTTFADNVASSSAGVTAPTDNGVPPKYSTCIYHANRLFVNDATNPNYVWYSNLGEPYTFASTNFLLFGDAAADLVKGFSIFDNSLVVFCENSQWILYMQSTDPADWSQVQIRATLGSKSPFGIAKFDNKILFPATQNTKFVGFAAISGNSIEPSSTLLTVSAAGSELQSDRIEPDMFLVQETYTPNISAITFKNKIYLSLTYDSNNTTNNRVYIYDFGISDLTRKNPAWAPYTSLNAAQFTIYGGKLYYGDSTATGFVYEMETSSYVDGSAAINSYYWTKEFSGFKGHENAEKDFRTLHLLVDKAGAYYMTVQYRVDSDKGEGTAVQINLNPGSTIWGAFIWGNATWGGGTDQEEIVVYLGAARGKRIQFKFTNQNAANQRFKVHGMQFMYNIRGRR
jgi:hypothetical protein